MRSRGMAIARWTALAVLGLVLAVALGLATLALTHQHVGLSAEPLSSGTRLAPPASTAPARTAPPAPSPHPVPSPAPDTTPGAEGDDD
jgi:hypothetical protein